ELIAASGRADLVTQASRYAAYRGQVNEAAAFPIPDLAGLLATRSGEPEPALLLGVARQESAFNTWGVSRAGARGLLQLMPRTARLMARALNLPYNPAFLTANPDYNIRLGRHYLGILLERYDAEVVLAMAAYNAGPRRVDEWLRLNGDPRNDDAHGLIDWVELIPFSETRNYVQRVLEGRNLYRQRLAEQDVATIRFLAVNGPLRPTPRPNLKPLSAARRADPTTIAADTPRPQPKPVLESRRAPALDVTPGSGPLPASFSSSLPASFDPAEVELLAESATIVVWPELKPGSPPAIEAGALPLPQPELKPRGR
ncbi:MAG: transglycosylase SLT domain-containing protein, partial [Geminicoccales bacterium]